MGALRRITVVRWGVTRQDIAGLDFDDTRRGTDGRNFSLSLFKLAAMRPWLAGRQVRFKGRLLAIERGVAYIASRDEIDHVFRNICGVIADALEILSDEN